MDKKYMISLSISAIIGLILGYLVNKSTRCLDGGQWHFYCKDIYEMGLPFIAFLIPIIIVILFFKFKK